MAIFPSINYYKDPPICPSPLPEITKNYPRVGKFCPPFFWKGERHYEKYYGTISIYKNKALKHAVFYSKSYFKIIKNSSDKKGMVEGHGVQVL